MKSSSMSRRIADSPTHRLTSSPVLPFKNFFVGKKVFITGHTGFKGSWLCLWLHSLGAKVTGYALKPPTRPSLFELCGINKLADSIIADIRDYSRLKKCLVAAKPDIIFHMAAQPLVLESYKDPVGTYSTNVMGTVHLLEAARSCRSVKAIVNVTSDKCYENRERRQGYRETEPMGGRDPYSSSKGCSELVTSAYRNSFFARSPSLRFSDSRLRNCAGVASARAGNVIGGGDWAENRLIPDCIRAVLKGKTIIVRNPSAVRPWQHVLEPLSGYLALAEKLYKAPAHYSEAWNFGPGSSDEKPVEWLVREFCLDWGGNASYKTITKKQPHEADYLKLDCSKAKKRLLWRPRWGIKTAIRKTVEWTKSYKDKKNLREICLDQIREYSSFKYLNS
ncbi:MAG: CDP-glucose 4,6-dehydratase [bacterium]